MDISSTKEKVFDLLEKHPNLRNNDLQLIAEIWYEELTRNGIVPVVAKKFVYLLTSKKLSNPESIRRMRARLQQKNEHLRGSAYYQRHNIEEPKAKQDLGY